MGKGRGGREVFLRGTPDGPGPTLPQLLPQGYCPQKAQPAGILTAPATSWSSPSWSSSSSCVCHHDILGDLSMAWTFMSWRKDRGESLFGLLTHTPVSRDWSRRLKGSPPNSLLSRLLFILGKCCWDTSETPRLTAPQHCCHKFDSSWSGVWCAGW